MSKREEILSFVVETARDISCCRDEEVVDQTSDLERDLGLDSLDKLELALKCEEKFKITIDDDEASDIETIGDLVNLIEKHLG